MFTTLSRLTSRPRLVLGLALLILTVIAVLGRGASERLLVGGQEDPAGQSSVASTILDARVPSSQANLLLLVKAAPSQAVDSPPDAAAGESVAARLGRQPMVTGVRSYWRTGSAAMRSANGQYALIAAHLAGTDAQADRTYQAIAASLGGRQGPVTVSFSGPVAVNHEVRTTISSDLKKAELIAVPVTLIILILVFGSLLAALLPLATGIIAILGSQAALKAVSEFTSVSVFAQNLTTALGLGLAIDYALLLTRRFREEQRKDLPPRAAAIATVRTAGRTVMFSALIVAVSLSSMLVFPMFFLRSFAYSGISVVLFAALAAVIVVPAALTLLGDRVNSLDLRRPLLRLLLLPARRKAGLARLAEGVMRRAPVFAVGVTAVLVLVGLPFFRVQFGIADYRQLPSGSQARLIQQTLQSSFPDLPTSAITVLAGSGDRTALGGYAARISRLPAVSVVQSAAGTYQHGSLAAPAAPADAARVSGGLSYLTVEPAAPDISPQSETLVRAIRGLDEPFTTMATGDAASVVDTEQSIAARLPAAGAIIALATLLVIFLFTRSVLIPLISVIASVLSLSATFGAVVWIFQWGHGSGLLGFTPTGFLDITLPVLMFCVAFGLSMDYSMFVLSRIKERYDQIRDPRAAVSYGIQRTGGIITAAAIILTVVLVAIGSSQVTNIKMFGLGVALAVLVDALVVRCLLMPAVLALVGRAAWWAPAPLRRFADRLGLREDEDVSLGGQATAPAGPVSTTEA